MDGSVLEEKSPFKMLELTSKMDWVSCIISIAEFASKKIGVLTYLLSIFLLRLLVYLYKSTTMHGILLSCLGWCSYVLLGIGG